MTRKTVLMAAACAALLWISTAQAATDEEKCLAGRAKAAAKYKGCVEKWLAKVYGSGSPDLVESQEKSMAKCRIKYAAAWTKLQGLTGSSTCGGQPRYVDNANGTITDNLTGLVWEKKSDNGDLHDKDALMTWGTGGAPYNGNGTAFTTFLRDGLNAGAGFAGANDWRLPTFAELQSMMLPEPWQCTTMPCVDAAFNASCAPGCTVLTCSCTRSNAYWTATTGGDFPNLAWVADIGDGTVVHFDKTNPFYVRAVRGGF